MRFPVAVVLGALAFPAAAQEEGAPLSAIDWLSRSVEPTSSADQARLEEPPISADASAPGITVTTLDGTGGEVRGVLSSEATGLPRGLWSGTNGAVLAGLIRSDELETLPALQDLLVTLMLAEADPPADGDARALLLARVDKLLDMGALEPARGLLESGDLLDPELFRRWFDVTLLTGTEHDACALLRIHPTLAPTLLARVFCLARNGDWAAAALTLNTARALGDVSPDEDELLARFLDPEFGPEEDRLAPPSRPTPLVYRLREAVGNMMPTTGLPLAFSHADLRATVAWRAQIEAAERLARHGALSENVLLAVYTARTPAASGGVWDRAAAIQRLDRATQAGDAAAASEALDAAWTAMREAGTEVPFARLYGEVLLDLGVTGELVQRVALLSPAYRRAAEGMMPGTRQEALLRAIALDDLEGSAATDAASAAILAGLADAPLPEGLVTLLGEGRIGEVVLRAILALQRGLDGDHAALTTGISALRAAGLEETARRAALQFLILGSRP